MTPYIKFGFKKLPFNIAQAPPHFQQLLSEVLKVLPFVFAYLDDIMALSENNEKHFKHLRTKFDRLQVADLKLNVTFSSVKYII